MKYMIASDIHGSYYYALQLMEAFKNHEADKLILLGDLLYHGPRNDLPKKYNPKKVIELLNQNKKQIYVIRGNCDTEVDQMVLEFPILSNYAIFSMDEIAVYAIHGHHMDIVCNDGDIVLFGHTHIPTSYVKDGVHYMNPGSVSIPKENSAHSYMIWEHNTFTWYDLNGNQYKKETI